MTSHHFFTLFLDGEKIEEEGGQYFPVETFGNETVARAMAPASAAMSE